MRNNSNDYVTRVLRSPSEVDAAAWNALLPAEASPFVRHEYFAALHDSGSATARTGWQPRFVTLWRGTELHAAAPMYLKSHSFGEYVFDWAWARAYDEHGLDYYPKAVIAVPFTPVPGPRLLARDAASRTALLQAVLADCAAQEVSSLHMLFAPQEDLDAAAAAGMMLRHTVQFHWENAAFRDFEAFLGSLAQDKRKKIRQERRKVAEAGVTFRTAEGRAIGRSDWEFFYRCYVRTYREHGNPPYLTREFFEAMAARMPDNWVLFVAERSGKPIACSLVAVAGGVAYGRYWGALERVDCLHFEACYYQPLAWCIANRVRRFEGGAQGEHKMARALMPVRTSSAHWLSHPAFAEAVERFLEREGRGVEGYLADLQERSPFRQA